MRGNAPTTGRMELLTRVAFFLAMVIVCARVGMGEALRDLMPVGPGTVAAPKGAGPATSLFLDLLCCVPAMLILLRRVMDETYVLRWTWSLVIMGALAAWAMASRFWAADRFGAMVSSADFAAAMVLIWSGAQLVRSQGRLRVVGGMCFGLFLVLIAHGLNQRLVDFPETVRQWNDPNSETSKWRYMREHGLSEKDFTFIQFEKKLLSGELRGFSASPNTYAALLVMLGLISFGVLMQRLKDGDGIGWAVPIAIALLAGVLCIWHTHSRTAYLTPIFGAGMIVILPRIEPWMARRARWIYVTAVGLFFLGVAAVIGHALAHGNLVDKSLTYRWYYWTGAYRMVQQHPITGVGWANFGNHYPEVRPDIASEEVQDPHDFLVRFFAELGIVGGLLALAWMMRLWWEMTRPVNAEVRIHNSEVRRRGLSSLAAVAMGAAVLNLLASTDWEQNSSWLILQVVGAAAGAGLLFLGMAVGTMRSLADHSLDDRPAPWVLRSMQVGLGIFLLHNLIDFSLFETGPMMLFCFLTGSVLGVRMPSVAGQMKRTGVVIAALSVATILWLGAAARMWLPTLFGEAAADRGDKFFRASQIRQQPRAINANMLDAAFAQYREAFSEQQLNGDYAWKAASVLLFKGAPGNLIQQMIDAAIKSNPRAAKYHLFKADNELAQSHPDKETVMKAFQDALAISPGDVGVRIEYAKALEKLGDREFAREQYREALLRDDKLPPDEPKRLSAEQRKQIQAKIAG